jgi:hypothetical protein
MPHQAGDLVATAGDALLIKIGMHPGIATGLTTATKHAPDRGQQLRIGLGPVAEGALEPVVVAAGTHAEAGT